MKFQGKVKCSVIKDGVTIKSVESKNSLLYSGFTRMLGGKVKSFADNMFQLRIGTSGEPVSLKQTTLVNEIASTTSVAEQNVSTWNNGTLTMKAVFDYQDNDIGYVVREVGLHVPGYGTENEPLLTRAVFDSIEVVAGETFRCEYTMTMTFEQGLIHSFRNTHSLIPGRMIPQLDVYQEYFDISDTTRTIFASTIASGSTSVSNVTDSDILAALGNNYTLKYGFEARECRFFDFPFGKCIMVGLKPLETYTSQKIRIKADVTQADDVPEFYTRNESNTTYNGWALSGNVVYNTENPFIFSRNVVIGENFSPEAVDVYWVYCDGLLFDFGNQPYNKLPYESLVLTDTVTLEQ